MQHFVALTECVVLKYVTHIYSWFSDMRTFLYIVCAIDLNHSTHANVTFHFSHIECRIKICMCMCVCHICCLNVCLITTTVIIVWLMHEVYMWFHTFPRLSGVHVYIFTDLAPTLIHPKKGQRR